MHGQTAGYCGVHFIRNRFFRPSSIISPFAILHCFFAHDFNFSMTSLSHCTAVASMPRWPPKPWCQYVHSCWRSPVAATDAPDQNYISLLYLRLPCRAFQLKNAECEEVKERMLKSETDAVSTARELSLVKADKKKLDAEVRACTAGPVHAAAGVLVCPAWPPHCNSGAAGFGCAPLFAPSWFPLHDP